MIASLYDYAYIDLPLVSVAEETSVEFEGEKDEASTFSAKLFSKAATVSRLNDNASIITHVPPTVNKTF